MAPTVGYYNRIIFNANSAGTGNFLVLSAVTGYRTPATAGVTDEKVVSYTAETADRTQWETGQGTYDVATTTVRRTTVRENSSGTQALINFATPPIVRLDLHAQDLTPDMWVDVRDFGYIGGGALDTVDQVAVQAAIDYAFANNLSAVRVPDGTSFYITSSLWLDPPANMRAGGTAVPTVFNFSMALIGGEGLASDTQDGVSILPRGAGFTPYFDFPAIVVGTGQGMRVAGFEIAGAGSLYTTTFDSDGIGIGISGGNGGASRTVIENCLVRNCYTGIKTGWNSDALGDSNTFIKCYAISCRVGYWISQTQNYINDFISCNSAGCTTAIYSPLGKSVSVYGGNFSAASTNSHDYPMASTSALSSVVGLAGTYLGQFSTTLTIGVGPFDENALTDGGTPVFTAWGVETASFGIVPLEFVSYNSGTNVMTLNLQQDWVYAQFGGITSPDFTLTDLEAEIQACTTLMAAERVTVFSGPGIHVYSCHIENPGTVTCLLDTDSGFTGDRVATLENIYFNWSPTIDLTGSLRKLQYVWPMVNAVGTGVSIAGGQFQHTRAAPPWLINVRGVGELWFDNAELFSPNIQLSSDGNPIEKSTVYTSRARGVGHWDKQPQVPYKGNLSSGDGIGFGWVQQNRGRYPALGHFPAPGIMPELTPTQYDLVTAAAPISADDPGEYPVICGCTLYRITDRDSATGSGGEVLAVSDHEFFSYGQDLMENWSYKGQSNCLYMDDIDLMFAGLKIGLDNGGGVAWYFVTGKYPDNTSGSPRTGYITVLGADNNNDNPTLLAGTKTVTYTGSTIVQEVYDFTTVGSGAGGGGGGREVLTVGTTWYVATTGSDITGDGTVGAPWETPNFALSEIADNYELGDEVHTLQLADGTYFVSIEKEFIGGGFLQILGNSSNVANVVLDGSLDSHYNAAFAWQTPQDTIIAIADMTLVSSVYIVRIINRCQFRMGYINFGGDLVLGASHAGVFKINCIATAAGSQITDRTDNITVAGNCAGYIGCDANMQVTLGENGGTTTMSGTPAFSVGTFFASSEAEIDTFGTTFSGAATGKRYALESGALLVTWDNGTLTYIPGNAEGTLTGGAVVTYRT